MTALGVKFISFIVFLSFSSTYLPTYLLNLPTYSILSVGLEASERLQNCSVIAIGTILLEGKRWKKEKGIKL